jgi:hypothetical protein
VAITIFVFHLVESFFLYCLNLYKSKKISWAHSFPIKDKHGHKRHKHLLYYLMAKWTPLAYFYGNVFMLKCKLKLRWLFEFYYVYNIDIRKGDSNLTWNKIIKHKYGTLNKHIKWKITKKLLVLRFHWLSVYFLTSERCKILLYKYHKLLNIYSSYQGHKSTETEV